MFTDLKLNLTTIRSIRKSPEVVAELVKRAERIRSAAGAADYEIDVRSDNARARVSVRTATARGRVLESKNQTLSRALDAGRG